MKKRIFISLTAAAVLTFTSYRILDSNNVFEPGPAPEEGDKFSIRDLYPDEDGYHDYLLTRVQFSGLGFKKIEIVKGDNFWKIARNNGVDIDTLIGANPHWDSLFASIGQNIIVPGCKGALFFARDFDEIGEIKSKLDLTDEDLYIEELPSMYRYLPFLYGDIDAIAVFIKDAKPNPDKMTKKMASEFTRRQMFRSPLGGRLSSFYGNRKHPIYRREKFHNGIDIAAKYGTPVGASREGVVIDTGWMGGYGKAVVIKHPGGYKTLYGHLSKITVRKGKAVKAGSLIGRVGSTGLSTGPHLHFTLWEKGRLINPLKVLW